MDRKLIVMRLGLSLIIFGLISFSCFSQSKENTMMDVLISADTVLLQGIDSVLTQLAYLQNESDSVLWFGNYNGQLLCRYNLSNNDYEIRDIGNFLEFDTIYSQGRNLAVSTSNDLPILANIQCIESDGCYVVYYKDYLLFYNGVPYLESLSFMSSINDKGIISEPEHIEHPVLTPWDTSDQEVLAGIDGSFYKYNNTVYTNSATKFKPGMRVVNSHFRSKMAWLTNEKKYLMPDSQLFAQPGTYIMTGFTSDKSNLLVNDGKHIVMLPEEEVIIPSSFFKQETYSSVGEIIMDFELFEDYIYIFTGIWNGRGFEYKLYRVLRDNVDNYISFDISLNSRPYSYNIYQGKLNVIEKNTSGFNLIQHELVSRK